MSHDVTLIDTQTQVLFRGRSNVHFETDSVMVFNDVAAHTFTSSAFSVISSHPKANVEMDLLLHAANGKCHLYS